MTERQAWVDFNETEDDDHIFTLLRHVAPGVALETGSRLLVGDGSGNLCFADVVAVRGEIVELALEGDTFEPAASHSANLLASA